jgi:hypothetical protein
MLKVLSEYKWSFIALGCLLGGLLLSRGGLASLAPLARMLLPVIIAFILVKFISNKVRRVASDFMAKNMGQVGGFGSVAGNGEKKVIDLCPKCGSYMNQSHKCKV